MTTVTSENSPNPFLAKQKLIKQIKMDSLKQTVGIEYSSSWRVSKRLKQDLGKKGVTLILIKSIFPYNAVLHRTIWSSTEEMSCMSAHAHTHTCSQQGLHLSIGSFLISFRWFIMFFCLLSFPFLLLQMISAWSTFNLASKSHLVKSRQQEQRTGARK